MALIITALVACEANFAASENGRFAPSEKLEVISVHRVGFVGINPPRDIIEVTLKPTQQAIAGQEYLVKLWSETFGQFEPAYPDGEKLVRIRLTQAQIDADEKVLANFKTARKPGRGAYPFDATEFFRVQVEKSP